MNIKDLILKYESLSHNQRIRLLKEKSKKATKKKSPEILVDYYSLFTVTLGCCTTLAQMEELEKLAWGEDKEIEAAQKVAEDYISSTVSCEVLKDDERRTLIKWIEDHVVERIYWIKESWNNYEGEYSQAMVSCRSSLIKPMFTYSPEQLEALQKVNKLFIEAGTQLFNKVKSFQKKLDVWNDGMSDKQTIQHMEAAFIHHEGTPYECWLSMQLEKYRRWGIGGDKSDDVSKPEGFVYREPEENNVFPGWNKEKSPEYWRHWSEGFDREKVKDIPICYLYHDLWDHQFLTYKVMDIIRMKEVRVDAGVYFEYREENEIWNK